MWQSEYKIKEKFNIKVNPTIAKCPHCGSQDLEWRNVKVTSEGLFMCWVPTLFCNKCNKDTRMDWVA